MNTREKRFAAAIYAQVDGYLSKPKDDQKKYGSMALKLPILVRTAGLAQALAFVESRGNTPQKALLAHLSQVVNEGNEAAFDLVARSRSSDLGEYILLTEKVLLALTWYKRFAQSVLGVKSTDEGE